MTATPEGTAQVIALLTEIRDEMRLDRAERRGKASGGGTGARAAGGTGARFGNYGRSKGQPVEGATMQDLEYYAGGCRRTLADPAKARFHDSERVLLAAIEAEIARQSGGGQGNPAPDGGPPDFGGPPPIEDDIPFIRAFWIPAF